MNEKNILKESYKGFQFISQEYINDCSGYALYFRHKKTGLDVFHILNDDSENLFSFCFRTPIKNSKGAAHILEHSVLCGSKKFPLKEPFTNLMNQSLNTFLNALTYPDKTLYPASSTVKEDYFNIMSVYADAVFFPLLKKESFMQEAHRIEFDENENPSIQGVVYNEMKGNYSNFESVAQDEIIKSLFKNTNYEYDSGGDPVKIPEFSYEEFKAFHKKYYVPSNCLLFLYGNILTEEQLDFIQENFLNELEKNSSYNFNPSKTPLVPYEFLQMEEPEKILSYDVIKKSAPDNGTEGANVSVNWRCNKIEDLFSRLECLFINEILTNHDASPLAKVLIDSDLGDDIISSFGLITDLRYLAINYGLHGVKSGDEQKVFDLIFSELRRISESGVSRQIIDSILMAIEFSNREIIRVSGPYSLVYLERVLKMWNYGSNPSDGLKYRETFDIIKKNAQNDIQYVQKLIKKYFLDNPEYTLLCVSSDSSFKENRINLEKSILNQKLKNLSKQELLSDLKKMHDYQSKKETEEELSVIGFIPPSKLDRNIRIIGHELKFFENSKNQKIAYIKFPQNTNGISYNFVAYPLDYLDLSDYEFLNFYSYCVTESGFKNRNWADCAEDAALVTGGIGTKFIPCDKLCTENALKFDKQNENLNLTGRDWIFFSLKNLSEKTKEAMDVFSDYFTSVDFSDEKRIKVLLDEYFTSYKSSLNSQGSYYMQRRAKKTSSHQGAFNEITHGISQFYSVLKFLKMDIHDIQERLLKIHKTILSSGCVIFSIADSDSSKVFEENLSDFINKAELTPLLKKNEIDEDSFKSLTLLEGESYSDSSREIFTLNTQVGYLSSGYPVSPMCTKENAAEVILAKYLSGSLLWEKIRTKGGAYGASASTQGINDGFFCTTYRDPNPEKSLKIFSECFKIASKEKLSCEDLSRFVTGNYGEAHQPHSPYSDGWIGIWRFLSSITDEDRKLQNCLELDVSSEDIQKAAERLYKYSLQPERNSSAVIIDKSKKNKKNTGIIVDLPL